MDRSITSPHKHRKMLKTGLGSLDLPESPLIHRDSLINLESKYFLNKNVDRLIIFELYTRLNWTFRELKFEKKIIKFKIFFRFRYTL